MKNPERKEIGCSQQILIKSTEAKVPQNFNDFLKNSNNKTRLIELTLKVIEDKKDEISSILKTDEIYFLQIIFVLSLNVTHPLVLKN